MRSIITLTLVFFFAAVTVFAQVDQQKQPEVKKSYLYKWTDDKGIAHITDGLGKVPKKYRDRAVQLESQSTDETTGEQQLQKGAAAPSTYTDQTGIDEDRKAEWQERMKDARKRQADAEQRYRELDQKRTEALGKWGGSAASGHLEGQEEAARIDQEMKQVQQEIDDAKNQIKNVIPDEARKAGVPPGWLRE
jgi:uncharacterized protein YukE